MALFGKKRLAKKSVEGLGIALDIGTEFVKALIFESSGEKANVIGIGRKRQELTDMQGGAVTDIDGVIRNAEIALARAQEMAGVLPDQAVIGIAGEQVKGLTTWVRYSRERPEKQIDLNELKEILVEVEKHAFERARKQLSSETGQREIDVRLVNSAIVDVKIDGYRVTNPIGFQGREVEVGVFNAFAPIVHLGALQTIASSLELDLLSIAVEPYAVARSVGLEDGADFSAIFLDVGGGTTDVAVVRSGGVEGTKMFALGGRSFTRRVQENLRLSFIEAEEKKVLYSSQKLSKTVSQKVKRAIRADAEIWLSGIELTMEEFVQTGQKVGQELLPSRILLCGGGSLLPEIAEELKSDWYKDLPFARKPSVQSIKPSSVRRVVDQTGSLRSAADITPMALASLALDLMADPTVVEGLLSKAVKTLRN